MAANLRLKIGDRGPDPDYRDGDVVSAYNRRAIRKNHAQRICCLDRLPNGQFARLNRNGRVPDTDVLKDFNDAVFAFKIERLSATEAIKTRLSDVATVRCTTGRTYVDFDGRDRVMHVGLLFERKVRTWETADASGVPLFGTPGRDVFYYGKQNYSHAAMDIVWAAIESKTPHREADYPDWPASDEELRRFLFVRVADFDDPMAALLESPLLDESDPDNPVILKRRRHGVGWRTELSLDGTTISRVDDPVEKIDLRQAGTFDRTVIVREKV